MLFKRVDLPELHLGTAFWIKYIKKRIQNNQNFLGCFIGQTGTSKSYSSISFKERLEEGELDESDVFMKASDFIKKLMEITEDKTKSYKGKVLIWDEAGKDLNAKSWQAKANRVVSVILQTFRKENLIVLFTLPYFSFLDPDARKLVHATFETMKIDRDRKTSILKAKLIQVNQDTGKMYKKYLRVYHEEKGILPVKRIELPLANQEFLKKYEEKKTEFTKETYKESYNELLALETKGKSNKALGETQKALFELYKIHQNQEKVAEIFYGDRNKRVIVNQNLRRVKEKLGKEAYEAELLFGAT